MMKLVLLIAIMFTLSLVHGFNNKPCQKNENQHAHKDFVTKHIVPESFDRSLKSEWEKYISNKGLCDKRRPKQSFIKSSDEDGIKKICNGEGYQLEPQKPPKSGNLCISDSTFWVYDLEVDNNCKVTNLDKQPTKNKVIVACDVIANQCVPVHFEKFKNQQPDNAKVCKP